jgi:hypothetical protein
MTSAAFADISLTGLMKTNYTNVEAVTVAGDTNGFAHDLDFTLKGQNGATAVSATFVTTAKDSAQTVTTDAISDTAAGAGGHTDAISTVTNSSGLKVENVFMTTNVAGVNIKTGSWSAADSLMTNGSRTDGKFEADMTVSGINVKYSDSDASNQSVTVSGAMQGVTISHEMGATATENVDFTDTKIGANVAGVQIDYRTKNEDGANNDMDSLQISKEFSGMTFTYANAEVEGTGSSMNSDGYLGEISDLAEISGFGVTGSLAGNSVKISKTTANTGTTATPVEDKYTEFVVTRPLASGATFEATYTDKAAAAAANDTKTLDLELRVAF